MTAKLTFKISNQYITFEIPEILTENNFKSILENNNKSYGFQVEISEYYINIRANSKILPIAVENGAQNHEFFANMYFYPKNSTQGFNLIRFAKSRYNAIKYSCDIEEIIYTIGDPCQKKYIILNKYNDDYFTGSDILSDFISKTQLLISYYVFQNTCSYNSGGSNDCYNNAIGVRFRLNTNIFTTNTLGQYFMNTNTISIYQMVTEKLCENNLYPKCIADNVPDTFHYCSFLDELTEKEQNSQYIASINDALRFHFPNHPTISNSTKFIKISPGDYTFMKVRIYNAFNVHSKFIYRDISSEMKSVPISIQEFCCVTNGDSLANILYNKIYDNFCNNDHTISIYSSQGVQANLMNTLYFSANEHIKIYGIISIGVSQNNVRFTIINNQCDLSHCACFSTNSNQICSCNNDTCNIINTESFANKNNKVNYSLLLLSALIISFFMKK